MAGTFSVCFTQQFDIDTSEFLTGGLLYVYDANTSTPSTIYEDSSLSSSQSNPVSLDDGGRIPAIWAANGNYRLVLRNSSGVTQFDVASTPAIGNSTSSSSSSATSVDATTLLKTGYTMWYPLTSSLTSWVRCNGNTIGSATSG